VHINDVCSAFDTAYGLLSNQKQPSHFKYAVSSDKSYQLKEVIRVFESVTNKKINVVWGGKNYRKREVMKLWNKGEKLPKWQPQITLKEGLKKYSL
jgi:UDP-glucose 4-epimerase